MPLEDRFQAAVQNFWDARHRQQQAQVERGQIDAGSRGAVTGGSQMGGLEVLVADLLREAGLEDVAIRTKLGLELPGYFRPEKKWDLLVVSRNRLVCAVEFKSQVGPSFGNNFNNRTEEAIGNAVDIWTAFREGRFGESPRPFVGYFFLLEDCDKVRRPVKVVQPHFSVDPIFQNTSYAQRYEVLCRRLLLDATMRASASPWQRTRRRRKSHTRRRTCRSVGLPPNSKPPRHASSPQGSSGLLNRLDPPPPHKVEEPQGGGVGFALAPLSLPRRGRSGRPD